MPGEPAVSVIMFARDAEKDVERALRALESQTLLASAAMEVIVVDDGSADRTHEIALQFCRERPELFRLHRQQTSAGPAAARITGLRLARGNYIGFAAPDGKAEPALYQRLLEACEQSGADLSGCAAVARVWTRQECREELLPTALAENTACLNLRAKLVRRDLIDRLPPEALASCESMLAARCLAFCERCATVPELLYHGPREAPGEDCLEWYAQARRLQREIGIDTERTRRLICTNFAACLRDRCARELRAAKTHRAFYERMIALAEQPEVREILACADREALDKRLRKAVDAFGARDWAGLEQRVRRQ